MSTGGQIVGLVHGCVRPMHGCHRRQGAQRPQRVLGAFAETTSPPNDCGWAGAAGEWRHPSPVYSAWRLHFLQVLQYCTNHDEKKMELLVILETTQEQDRVDQCLCELGALMQEEDSEHFQPRVLQSLYAQYAAGTVESHQDASQCGMTEHFPCFGLAEGSLVLPTNFSSRKPQCPSTGRPKGRPKAAPNKPSKSPVHGGGRGPLVVSALWRVFKQDVGFTSNISLYSGCGVRLELRVESELLGLAPICEVPWSSKGSPLESEFYRVVPQKQ